MSDYQKALKIQELREQRVDLMWDYIVNQIEDSRMYIIKHKILSLDKQIKELQNG